MNKLHKLADFCVALTGLVMAAAGLLAALDTIMQKISAMIG